MPLKIVIQSLPNKILAVSKDYRDLEDTSEMAQAICHLENLKQELMVKWRMAVKNP